MADSQDAIELTRRARRRLVGAIALVVFVVIALPIVLDREPKPASQDLSIQIPAQDAGKFSSPVLPAEPPAPPKAEAATPEAAKTELAAAPKAEAVKPEPVKSEAPKAAPAAVAKAETKPAPATEAPPAKVEAVAAKPAASPAKPEAAPKSAAKEAPKAAVGVAVSAEAKPASTESFVVPLGLFSKAENAKQVRSKAGAAGFKTFTEAVAGSDRVRVRAGPFSTRDAAEKARDKLKAAGLDVGAVAAK